MTFRLGHLIAAVVLHALVLGLLLGGMQCTKKPTRPPVIRAVLLDPDRKQAQQQRRADEQQRQEQRRRAETEKRRLADQQRRLADEQKRRDADLQKQKLAEDARRKKAAELKQQQELAEQKKAEEQARKKQEQEQQRERQDQAQRELQEEARMEEAMREEATRREIEREAAARAASERELRQAEWADVLERHVQKYWIRPAAAAQDFECTVDVQMLPDGTVTSARVARSCGSAPLDKSVEDAVYRSSPMPRPADPSVFDRELIIIFRPRL